MNSLTRLGRSKFQQGGQFIDLLISLKLVFVKPTPPIISLVKKEWAAAVNQRSKSTASINAGDTVVNMPLDTVYSRG